MPRCWTRLLLLLLLCLPFVDAFVPCAYRGLTTTRRFHTQMTDSTDSIHAQARAANLYFPTPLLFSPALTRAADGCPVYIKLDCLQPSGSFKDRGMAHLILSSSSSSIVSSSGGNAGLAAATVAQSLGIPCTVVVPETTKPMVVETLRTRLGATVIVTGENWNAADAVAQEKVQELGGTYVPPFEHPLLWAGHSTVVDEVLSAGLEGEVEAIVVSVGGGGLLCGVLEGLERHKCTAKVVAAETEGACSFAKAWEKQELVKLDAITSVATSLGALQVSPTALSRAKAHLGTVETAVCTDKEAVEACAKVCNLQRTRKFRQTILTILKTTFCSSHAIIAFS